MKAWQKKNGVLTLADVPEPLPAADQIVVQVRAISLNRGEVRGIVRAAECAIPGWDVAGTVLEPAQLGASPSKGARDLQRLMALVRDGKLRSPISLRRPWTELPATMRELEMREYPGKAVLEVSS